MEQRNRSEMVDSADSSRPQSAGNSRQPPRKQCLSGKSELLPPGKKQRLVAELEEIALATAGDEYESGACDCTWTSSWVCPSSSAATKLGAHVAKDKTTTGHDDVCFYFCCEPDDSTARREAQACIQQRNADAKKYHDSLHGILFYIIITPIAIALALIVIAFSLVTYPLRAMFDDEADVILL